MKKIEKAQAQALSARGAVIIVTGKSRKGHDIDLTLPGGIDPDSLTSAIDGFCQRHTRCQVYADL